MIKCGTTTVEAKSGYGLDAPNEIKMLRVIHRAKTELKDKIDISCTYCGAHSIPKYIFICLNCFEFILANFTGPYIR